MDISISSSMTISTGNYGSIKPSVTISKTNIDEKDFDNEYRKLSAILDILINNEIIKLSDNMDTFNEFGYKRVVDMLRKSEEKMNIELKELLGDNNV